MEYTWPGWENVGLIGEGSFGKVFRIHREEYGKDYEAALKVITIPASQSDVKAAYEEGMDEESVTQYFRSFVEDIVAEFALMAELKGNSNIVSYEDHMVVQHEDQIGWDILIRMELLTALPDYVKDHSFTEEDVIRLGIHMACALELCRRRGIIHRDIKPENIFVSRDGYFKLGDFGVARVAEKTISVMSRKGTYNYMAPEVYKGEEYGYRADIYSLGLVLYRFLNDNRVPFLPPYPQAIQYCDREKALQDRMTGLPIPEPVHGSQCLKKAVLKACAYEPLERYASATELREALEEMLRRSCGDAEEKQVAEEKMDEGAGEAEEEVLRSEADQTGEETVGSGTDREEREETEPDQAEEEVVRSEPDQAGKETETVSAEGKRLFWHPFAGSFLFVGTFLLGTLLFSWDTLYNMGSCIERSAYARHAFQAFREGFNVMLMTILPLLFSNTIWRKGWGNRTGKTGKKVWKILAPVLIVLLGLFYGAEDFLLGWLSAIGCFLYMPVTALGILLILVVWFVLRIWKKRGMTKNQYFGCAMLPIVISAWGIMMYGELDLGLSRFYIEIGGITASFSIHNSAEDTPAAVFSAFLTVYIIGLLMSGSGRLWVSGRKGARWAEGILLVLTAILAAFPIGAVLRIGYDMPCVPVAVIAGLLLGAAALWGSWKLANILRRSLKKGGNFR